MNSKLFLGFVSVFAIANAAYSQNSEVQFGKTQIGIAYSSFGTNDMFYFEQLDGANSYQSDHFFTLGLHYLHRLNPKLSIETGIEYSHHRIIVEPNVPPNADDRPFAANFSLISIPITLQLNLSPFFFMNGGLILDMNTSFASDIDAQTGMGGMLGLGLGYGLPFGISTFVNPYFKVHSLLPFFSDHHPLRLLETGIRLGFMYRLP
ncbi:MAG: outer membrane beta-barrel protein [Saprospiraceae bacterium]|nr:outer membrane beta-barrel protein [Saprospiraceae bacterium]